VEALQRLKRATVASLLPKSRAPEAAMSGLYLYFSCLGESHTISQSIDTVEGSFWHGIMHRQEPDANNARYWFRQVPSHPIFAELAAAAGEIEARFPKAGFSFGGRWDPIRFVEVCDRARQEPGSTLAGMALELQRLEWQRLFHYCASEGSREL